MKPTLLKKKFWNEGLLNSEIREAKEIKRFKKEKEEFSMFWTPFGIIRKRRK